MGWHNKGQNNITLTAAQREYVTENYNHMSTYEMGRNLGLPQSKVYENMKKMGLQRVQLGRKPKESSSVKAGFFDEKEYAKSWA
jgi:hypothetical protein